MKLVFLAFFSLGFFHSAMAAELSWSDCVQLAAKNSPVLRSAEANLSSAQAQSLGSRNGFLPQVSGALGYSYGNSGSTAVVVATPSGGEASTYSASLTASENVFNGLADLAKVREARATELIAAANLKTVRAQISYSLRTSFEALDYSKKSVQLAGEIISRREQNLRLVQLRFFHGVENKGSVMLYQAYLLDAKYAQTQSKDQVVLAKNQLAQALGSIDPNNVDIKGTVPLTAPAPPVSFDQIAAQVPSYEQAQAQINFNDAAVTLARAGFFPTLALTGTTGNTAPDFFPNQNHWSLGVGLTVPLFSGGKDYYAVKAAAETRSASELTLESTLLQNRSTLQQNFNGFAESVDKLKVDQSYLEASKVRAEIARANYNNGLTSFQDWDLAENDLISRLKNVLASEQNRVLSEAAWEQALGRGVLP